MWIVQFNGAKSGKRTNIYGPFSCAANAHAYGLMWMEDDEALRLFTSARRKGSCDD